MTSENFVNWLTGYLDGKTEIEGHQLLKIKQKLETVNVNNNPWTFTPSSYTLYTYPTNAVNLEPSGTESKKQMLHD